MIKITTCQIHDQSFCGQKKPEKLEARMYVSMAHAFQCVGEMSLASRNYIH